MKSSKEQRKRSWLFKKTQNLPRPKPFSKIERTTRRIGYGLAILVEKARQITTICIFLDGGMVARLRILVLQRFSSHGDKLHGDLVGTRKPGSLSKARRPIAESSHGNLSSSDVEVCHANEKFKRNLHIQLSVFQVLAWTPL